MPLSSTTSYSRTAPRPWASSRPRHQLLLSQAKESYSINRIPILFIVIIGILLLVIIGILLIVIIAIILIIIIAILIIVIMERGEYRGRVFTP